jgi:hypothetical protein
MDSTTARPVATSSMRLLFGADVASCCAGLLMLIPFVICLQDGGNYAAGKQHLAVDIEMLILIVMIEADPVDILKKRRGRHANHRGIRVKRAGPVI